MLWIWDLFFLKEQVGHLGGSCESADPQPGEKILSIIATCDYVTFALSVLCYYDKVLRLGIVKESFMFQRVKYKTGVPWVLLLVTDPLFTPRHKDMREMSRGQARSL